MDDVTRGDAERIVEERCALPGLPWSGWLVMPEKTVACDVGWVIFARPAPSSKPPDSWRNIQKALFPEMPEQGPCGAGPFIVTRNGELFGTGSAHSAEAYCEDVRVMTGMTRNPLRLVRYLWRRSTDGRTAFRLAR